MSPIAWVPLDEFRNLIDFTWGEAKNCNPWYFNSEEQMRKQMRIPARTYSDCLLDGQPFATFDTSYRATAPHKVEILVQRYGIYHNWSRDGWSLMNDPSIETIIALRNHTRFDVRTGRYDEHLIQQHYGEQLNTKQYRVYYCRGLCPPGAKTKKTDPSRWGPGLNTGGVYIEETLKGTLKEGWIMGTVPMTRSSLLTKAMKSQRVRGSLDPTQTPMTPDALSGFIPAESGITGRSSTPWLRQEPVQLLP